MTSEKKESWIVPGYPELKFNDNIGQAAIEGQIYTYPKVARQKQDDYVPGQSYGLVSFMLFDEPKKLSNGEFFSGFMKLRGNYGDDSSAKHKASKIILENDSRHKIQIAPVGNWLPITNNEILAGEIVNINTDEKQPLLDKTHTYEYQENQKISKEKKYQREVEERRQQLLDDGDIYDDPKSVKYYSMKRVTGVRLLETRDKLLSQIEEVNKNISKIFKETKDIEKEFEDYPDMWIDVYNEERRKGGIPDYVPEKKFMDEYENFIPPENSD